MFARILPLLVLMAACNPGLPPPDAALSAQSLGRAAPTLVPLDPLLAQASQFSRAQAAEGALAGRANGLAQAGRPASPSADLTERARLLRARAERLRAVDI